jgi:hypothetical protein
MTQKQFYSGEAARDTDVYRQLNIFDVPTGMTVRQGETFSGLSRGFRVQWLLTQSAHKLRNWAARCRRLAGAAMTTQVRDDLLKVTQRFEALVHQRDAPSGRTSTGRQAPFPDDVIMGRCLTW